MVLKAIRNEQKWPQKQNSSRKGKVCDSTEHTDVCMERQDDNGFMVACICAKRLAKHLRNEQSLWGRGPQEGTARRTNLIHVHL